jgi:glutamate/tyrosine decarboxylase-like PLP-dependent enzyme
LGGVAESLRSLEAQSRQLDTSPGELSEWLDRLGRFSGEFLAANAQGPAFHGAGAGPPARTPLPLAGASFESVLEEYREAVLTRSLVTTSGRFFGYVPGGALPSAAVAEFVAALTNPYASVYGASPGATQIENSAVAWLIEMIGYPTGAWGTLQSGGSLATLAAIVAAREARPQADRARGVVYMTDECHLAVRKALHIAGLGDLPVRAVAVDDRLRMSVTDLERKVAEDQKQGLLPWLVFASAGTVNTGAVDPLDGIAAVARGAGLWLHVDAAYGGFFILTERAHALLAGMAQADSVVLDPHKGLFLPSGCGAVLVRDGEALRKGFAFTSSYLSDVHAGADLSPTDYSPELTRHFRALRLWMSLKLHGVEPFKAALEEKLILARLVHERLSAMRAIETAPEPELSCVAFRVRGEGDRATEQMLDRVLERGRVQMSSTRLRGRLYVRMCILCFRSHLSDVEEALAEIAKAVARVAALPAPEEP